MSKNKRNGNGKSNGKLHTDGRVQPVASGIELTGDEKTLIRNLTIDLDKKKALLGDALFKLMGSGAFDVLKQIAEANDRLNQAGAALLSARGLDPADPSKGRYNLDTDTLTLTRVE